MKIEIVWRGEEKPDFEKSEGAFEIEGILFIEYATGEN